MINKNRIRKKIICLVLTAIFMLSGTVASAASKGSFTFNIYTAIYGTTKFSLANKSTTVKMKATAYNLKDKKVSGKKYYAAISDKSTSINKIKWKGTKPADGETYSLNMGTPKKGTYYINVKTAPLQKTPVTYYLKGSGSINQ